MLGWRLEMRIQALLMGAILLGLVGGGCRYEPPEPGVVTVTLPGGQKIRAEVMSRPEDMARGMMFREHLAPDRGMLFVHGAPGRYRYWMYQCLIPLDILWMDAERRIVEISENTPPCRGQSWECPSYGGNHDAQFVLELAGGMARKYGLKLGDRLSF
jgi:uncharacterized membrane protein (UPF0127 family)